MDLNFIRCIAPMDLTLLENRPFIDQNDWSKSKMVESIDQKMIGQNYRPKVSIGR